MPASIYRRRNGELGASCDGTADTGHTITEDSAGMLTVYSDESGEPIAKGATRQEAESAIERDWRKPR